MTNTIPDNIDARDFAGMLGVSTQAVHTNHALSAIASPTSPKTWTRDKVELLVGSERLNLYYGDR